MKELGNNELLEIQGGYSAKELGEDVGYFVGYVVGKFADVLDAYTGMDSK